MKRRQLVISRIQATPFEAWVALLAIATSVTFLFDSDALEQSAVGQVFRPWDYVWNIGYGLAGMFTLYGVVRVWHRLEIAGLTLLAASAAVQLVSLWTVRGAPSITSILTYVGIVGACMLRVRILAAGRDVILARHTGDAASGTSLGIAAIDTQRQVWSRRAGRGPVV